MSLTDKQISVQERLRQIRNRYAVSKPAEVRPSTLRSQPEKQSRPRINQSQLFNRPIQKQNYSASKQSQLRVRSSLYLKDQKKVNQFKDNRQLKLSQENFQLLRKRFDHLQNPDQTRLEQRTKPQIVKRNEYYPTRPSIVPMRSNLTESIDISAIHPKQKSQKFDIESIRQSIKADLQSIKNDISRNKVEEKETNSRFSAGSALLKQRKPTKDALSDLSRNRQQAQERLYKLQQARKQMTSLNQHPTRYQMTNQPAVNKQPYRQANGYNVHYAQNTSSSHIYSQNNNQVPSPYLAREARSSYIQKQPKISSSTNATPVRGLKEVDGSWEDDIRRIQQKLKMIKEQKEKITDFQKKQRQSRDSRLSLQASRNSQTRLSLNKSAFKDHKQNKLQEIMNLFNCQIGLDNQLRQMKSNFQLNQKRITPLKRALSSKGIHLSDQQIKSIFTITAEESNPFQEFKDVKAQQLAHVYQKAQRHWNTKIRRQFQGHIVDCLLSKITNKQQQGTVQDFVRVINLQLKSLYKKRDVMLITRRLGSINQSGLNQLKKQ